MTYARTILKTFKKTDLDIEKYNWFDLAQDRLEWKSYVDNINIIVPQKRKKTELVQMCKDPLLCTLYPCIV